MTCRLACRKCRILEAGGPRAPSRARYAAQGAPPAANPAAALGTAVRLAPPPLAAREPRPAALHRSMGRAPAGVRGRRLLRGAGRDRRRADRGDPRVLHRRGRGHDPGAARGAPLHGLAHPRPRPRLPAAALQRETSRGDGGARVGRQGRGQVVVRLHHLEAAGRAGPGLASGLRCVVRARHPAPRLPQPPPPPPPG